MDQADSLRKIKQRILNGTNFSLARLGDGEVQIMRSKKIRGIDGWYSDGGRSLIKTQLLGLSKLCDKNIIYGVPCKCHFPDDNAYIKRMLTTSSENIVASNVFVNSTFEESSQLLASIKDESLFFVSKRYSQLSENWLKNNSIEKSCVYPIFDGDCFGWWNRSFVHIKSIVNRAILQHSAKKYILMAGGPMASALAIICFRENRNKTYIDVGSALDASLFGISNRPYQLAGHPDQFLNCVI